MPTCKYPEERAHTHICLLTPEHILPGRVGQPGRLGGTTFSRMGMSLPRDQRKGRASDIYECYGLVPSPPPPPTQRTSSPPNMHNTQCPSREHPLPPPHSPPSPSQQRTPTSPREHPLPAPHRAPSPPQQRTPTNPTPDTHIEPPGASGFLSGCHLWRIKNTQHSYHDEASGRTFHGRVNGGPYISSTVTLRPW